MIRISKDNLGANFNQIVRCACLDSATRADGHKDRGIDYAVCRPQFPYSGLGLRIRVEECEFAICH